MARYISLAVLVFAAVVCEVTSTNTPHLFISSLNNGIKTQKNITTANTNTNTTLPTVTEVKGVHSLLITSLKKGVKKHPNIPATTNTTTSTILKSGQSLLISSLKRDIKKHRNLSITTNTTSPSTVIKHKGEGGGGHNGLQGVPEGVFPASLRSALPPLLPHYDDASNTREHNRLSMQNIHKWLSLHFNFYLPDTTNVSSACRIDIETFYKEILAGELWAVKMVDSWGKFADGVLEGNTMIPGMMDECLSISVDQELPQAHFTGQYCAITYVKAPVESTRGINTMDATVRIGGVAAAMGVSLPSNLYGTCIPSTCTKHEYEDSLRTQLEGRGLDLRLLACQTADSPTLQYSAADVIMIVTLSLLALLVLTGTSIDVWVIYTGRTQQDTGSLRYLLVFSFYTNIKKMFRINVKESEEVISCLHGIRVLSLAWIVLGHTYLLSQFSTANKVSSIKMIQDYPYYYQIILNAYPSVDTFYVMSGLLVSYNLTKEFNKSHKFNIPLYYIHRFIRLVPAILLLCGILAVFPPLFVSGAISPMMTQPGYMVDLCRRYWWRDAFFMTNLFFSSGDSLLSDTESCLPVCWFTAVDFQLYIVTPLMLLPILYRRKPGMAWLCFLVAASVAIPAIIIGVNQLPPSLVIGVEPSEQKRFVKHVYMMPWCRASPYLAGLCLGYFLRRVDRDTLRLKWWQATLCWLAAFVTMSAVVFGMTDYNSINLSGDFHQYEAAVSILYGGLHRLAWGIAVGWTVLACHLGYGGPINSLLSHPFWQPISRLTYATFLIAFNAQFFILLFMPKIPTYFSDFNMVMIACGVLVLSTCGAVLLSLLTESPVLGLERLLLRKEK